MSGGSLNYFYSDLEDHAGDFKDKELDDLVKDLAHLFYEREWYLSGDTNEGSWREARDRFKAKWFTQTGRQERIEKYLDEIRTEVLDGLGLYDGYCQNCEHWAQCEDEGYSKYGKCEFYKDCLMHRSEKCDQFKKRN